MVQRTMAPSRMATMVSSMETSTYWPTPVFSRCHRAVMMAKAACTAAFTSPREVPTRVGGFPGWPVMDMRPLMAWEITSKAIRSE